MPTKFKEGDRVLIEMMGNDSTFQITKNCNLVPVKETSIRGTGIVLGVVPDEDMSSDRDQNGKPKWGGELYWVAVVQGRFDSHRNEQGRLACWYYELEHAPWPQPSTDRSESLQIAKET